MVGNRIAAGGVGVPQARMLDNLVRSMTQRFSCGQQFTCSQRFSCGRLAIRGADPEFPSSFTSFRNSITDHE